MGSNTIFPLTTSEIDSTAKRIQLDLVKPMNSYDCVDARAPNLDDWEIDESDSNDW